jgi:hypothetical protein
MLSGVIGRMPAGYYNVPARYCRVLRGVVVGALEGVLEGYLRAHWGTHGSPRAAVGVLWGCSTAFEGAPTGRHSGMSGRVLRFRVAH